MTLVQPSGHFNLLTAVGPAGANARSTGTLAPVGFKEQLRSLTGALRLEPSVPSERRKGVPDGKQEEHHLAGRPNLRARLEVGASGTSGNPAGESSSNEERYHQGKEPGCEGPSDDVPQLGPGGAIEMWAEPLVRVLSTLSPGLSPSTSPAAVHAANPPDVVLDRIAQQLVRKVGLGTSAVHLEFGDGVFAQGKLTVQATDHGLEIALHAPHGIDASQLCVALAERFKRKGLRVASLEVT